MLVLSRKVGEKIVIDDRITVTVTRIAGNRIALGIDAPERIRVVRGELRPRSETAARPAEPESRDMRAPHPLDRSAEQRDPHRGRDARAFTA